LGGLQNSRASRLRFSQNHIYFVPASGVKCESYATKTLADRCDIRIFCQLGSRVQSESHPAGLKKTIPPVLAVEQRHPRFS
jgi:hypothetical protein